MSDKSEPRVPGRRRWFHMGNRSGKVLIGLDPDFALTLVTALRDATSKKSYGNSALDAFTIALGSETLRASGKTVPGAARKS